jgi:hypothetical protein
MASFRVSQERKRTVCVPWPQLWVAMIDLDAQSIGWNDQVLIVHDD